MKCFLSFWFPLAVVIAPALASAAPLDGDAFRAAADYSAGHKGTALLVPVSYTHLTLPTIYSV